MLLFFSTFTVGTLANWHCLPVFSILKIRDEDAYKASFKIVCRSWGIEMMLQRKNKTRNKEYDY